MKVDLEYVNSIVWPDYFQPRQFDVLKLKLLGYTVQQIADELGPKAGTIYDRCQEIRNILGISGLGGRREMMQWAIDNGLIEVNF